MTIPTAPKSVLAKIAMPGVLLFWCPGLPLFSGAPVGLPVLPLWLVAVALSVEEVLADSVKAGRVRPTFLHAVS